MPQPNDLRRRAARRRRNERRSSVRSRCARCAPLASPTRIPNRRRHCPKCRTNCSTTTQPERDVTAQGAGCRHSQLRVSAGCRSPPRRSPAQRRHVSPRWRTLLDSAGRWREPSSPVDGSSARRCRGVRRCALIRTSMLEWTRSPTTENRARSADHLGAVCSTRRSARRFPLYPTMAFPTGHPMPGNSLLPAG